MYSICTIRFPISSCQNVGIIYIFGNLLWLLFTFFPFNSFSSYTFTFDTETLAVGILGARVEDLAFSSRANFPCAFTSVFLSCNFRLGLMTVTSLFLEHDWWRSLHWCWFWWSWWLQSWVTKDEHCTKRLCRKIHVSVWSTYHKSILLLLHVLTWF